MKINIKLWTLMVALMAMVGCSFDNGDDSEVNTNDNTPSVSENDSMAQDKSEVEVKSEKEIDAIFGQKWQLVTLEGQPVEPADNQEQAIYFELQRDDNRVMGFAGCNTFNGTYTLEKGMRIRFSQMLTTLKACPDVDVDEQAFLAVFDLADNYTINNGELSLNIGRRAPLAVFEQQ